MNGIQIFNSSEFGEIRTAVVNDEPMFCLADVCKALELEQVSRVKSRLNEDGVTTSKVIDRLGREQTATFINESNLYKTIFQSRKESAERFTEWVTGEVLPSIRKNGGYIAGQESMTDDELLEKAVLVAQRKIAERDKIIERQRQKIEADKPKTIFADAVSASQTSILIGDLAKLICQNGYQIGQKRLFQWMRDNGYLGKSGACYNMPMQRYVEQGLFEIKERSFQDPDGIVRTALTPKVSGKGQLYFINKFLGKEKAG